uniref:Uncharacterized protein n=1 Tax=Siphoviridae sp. ctEkS11 TaxID=2827272 RepID=A0A8S5R4R6_9CAUD|nr:MAG TPA: hypothetical protein [Siphoviridae sp. ctEkS11]DAV77170.1 MAG TPA: hypothetical protein [Caudoviricetes sp.]
MALLSYLYLSVDDTHVYGMFLSHRQWRVCRIITCPLLLLIFCIDKRRI